MPVNGDGIAEYDLVVIGAGPAGEKGAAQAAYFGKRVALVERAQVGGAVVNTGGLPGKALRETALYLAGLRQRDLHGLSLELSDEVSPDDLFFRKRAIVRSYLDVVRENIDRHGIDLVEGAARFEDERTLRVDSEGQPPRFLRGACILVATGSRPHRPPEVPFDGEYVYDSDSILQMRRIPSSLIVIGGGVIGCEYASLFATLGLPVTLVDGGQRLLPFLDRELSEVLAARMTSAGVQVLFGARMSRIQVAESGEQRAGVLLEDGRNLAADAILFCGGRRSNTDHLGLEHAGVRLGERGLIAVNEHYQTSAPHIYAAGDVIGFPALAATSMEQARVAVCHAFGFSYKRQVSTLVPYGLYTVPELSMVGESEDSLAAAGIPYLVGRASYRTNPRGQIVADTEGLLKLLFSPEDKRLLGVHIIGERASELIHIGQACMQFGGSIDYFIDNVFNFPTLADLYKYAAYDGLGNLERQRAAVTAGAVTATIPGSA